MTNHLQDFHLDHLYFLSPCNQQNNKVQICCYPGKYFYNCRQICENDLWDPQDVQHSCWKIPSTIYISVTHRVLKHPFKAIKWNKSMKRFLLHLFQHSPKVYRLKGSPTGQGHFNVNLGSQCCSWLYVAEITWTIGAAIKTCMNSYVQLRFWQIIASHLWALIKSRSSFTFQYKVRKECAADSLRVEFCQITYAQNKSQTKYHLLWRVFGCWPISTMEWSINIKYVCGIDSAMQHSWMMTEQKSCAMTKIYRIFTWIKPISLSPLYTKWFHFHICCCNPGIWSRTVSDWKLIRETLCR